MRKSDDDSPRESTSKKVKGEGFFFSTNLDKQEKNQVLSNTPPKIDRRLDSLARLLEGSMICASVFLTSEGFLYVTTNGIHLTKRNFPNNLKTNYLKDLFLHFMSSEFLKSQINQITSGDIDILIKIYSSKLNADYHGDVKTMPQIADKKLRKMLKFFSENIDGSLRDLSDETLAQFLEDDEFAIFKSLKTIAINKVISLQKKLSELRHAYLMLWGHFRDYMKFKNIVIRNEILITDYRILAIGQDNEHAELKMLSFILSEHHFLIPKKNSSNKHYIGISKLCCPNCICAVKSVNKCMHSQVDGIGLAQSEISAVFDSDNVEQSEGEVGSNCNEDLLIQSVNLEVNEMIQSELPLNDDDNIITVRGSHDLVVTKWIKPAFLYGDAFLSSDHYLAWSCLSYLQDKKSENSGWKNENSSTVSKGEEIKLKLLAKIYTDEESGIKKLREKTLDTAKKSMCASPSSSDVQASPPSNVKNEDIATMPQDPFEIFSEHKK